MQVLVLNFSKFEYYYCYLLTILDSDTVNSILGIITKDNESEGSNDSPKLFNNVNISSFNVSFNAGRKTKENPSNSQSGRKKSTVLQRRVSERRDSRYEHRLNVL